MSSPSAGSIEGPFAGWIFCLRAGFVYSDPLNLNLCLLLPSTSARLPPGPMSSQPGRLEALPPGRRLSLPAGNRCTAGTCPRGAVPKTDRVTEDQAVKRGCGQAVVQKTETWSLVSVDVSSPAFRGTAVFLKGRLVLAASVSSACRSYRAMRLQLDWDFLCRNGNH